ncbi:hypothetical protein EYF80_033114 [Liparis tanakae]|uniref:Uncharacterized protein n=1 Tax=Liparis tanakae TaxID=230148 RepID=A0A4Z2GSW2_9TELE|nr:hypothetical protein EYF80_033114 [Liparis tanakae]
MGKGLPSCRNNKIGAALLRPPGLRSRTGRKGWGNAEDRPVHLWHTDAGGPLISRRLRVLRPAGREHRLLLLSGAAAPEKRYVPNGSQLQSKVLIGAPPRREPSGALTSLGALMGTMMRLKSPENRTFAVIIIYDDVI